MARIVIDTNIALDLLVFADPAVACLHEQLLAEKVVWLINDGMRHEFERVLSYPGIAPRLVSTRQAASDVLAAYDRLTHVMEPAPLASCRCVDPDDQQFIDLAVQHKAWLLSKDAAVLALRRPLHALGVQVSSTWPAP